MRAGFFRIISVIFGSSIVCGSLGFFLSLVFALDKRPPAVYPGEQFQQKFRNYYFITKEDFQFSVLIGLTAAALIAVLGILFWIRQPREEVATFAHELYQNTFVRITGITLTGTALFGVIFTVMEYVTASREYPAKWHEMPQFLGGGSVLTLAGYGLVSLLRRLFKGKSLPG